MVARRFVHMSPRLLLLLSLAAAVLCGGCDALRCGKSRVIKKSDTCKSLMVEIQISLSLFAVLNPGVTCSKLPVGKMVCVLPLNRKVAVTVTDIPILSSSALLKLRPISSLLTWNPFWSVQVSTTNSSVQQPPSVPFRMCDKTDSRNVTEKVSLQFFQAAKSAGLVTLSDGRQFRYSSYRQCWRERTSQKLHPFISVATCTFSAGAKLFVSELYDRKTPNDKIHNGCVRVDDTCEEGGGVAEFAHFVGTEPPSPIWREGGARVHVREAPDCVLLDYS